MSVAMAVGDTSSQSVCVGFSLQRSVELRGGRFRSRQLMLQEQEQLMLAILEQRVLLAR